ncbi:MAG: 50S ribosomal protein L25/general stress protein Ctc [Desulfobacterales bacterium]
MELIELKTNTRTTTGNGPARRLRKEGQVPAVLYGSKAETVLLSINSHSLDMILKGGGAGQVLFNLVIHEDGETRTSLAMIKELQIHPVSRNFLHVDFYEINMDQKIKVKVPVVTTGKSAGVELGGMLQIVRRELEVQCLPLSVPESIVIDITDLDIGDSVHVGDISLEGEIEILEDGHYTVVNILSPKMEEAEEREGEAEAEAAEREETPEAGSEE